MILLFNSTVLTILVLLLVSTVESLSEEFINNVRDKIVQSATDKDLLVFLGKKASNFYEAVKPFRGAISVPLSVDHLDEWEEPKSHEENAVFYKTIIRPIIQKASGTGKRILLVDHCLTGNSVDDFCTLLTKYYPSCEPAFLNLVTFPQWTEGFLSPTFPYLGTIVLPENEGNELFTDLYRPDTVESSFDKPQNPSSVLSNLELQAINSGRNQILEKTNNDDILLFIGNSGSYIFHAIKKLRKSFLVPISGRYSETDISPSKEEDVDTFRREVANARSCYQRAFISPIAEKAKKSKARIVLIDFSLSGKSVDAFRKLLKDTCSQCASVFLGLVPENIDVDLQQLGTELTPPQTVGNIGYILLPDISGHFFVDGYLVRLAPYFPIGEWHRSSPKIMAEHETRPEVKALIDQIANYHWEEPSKHWTKLVSWLKKKLGFGSLPSR